MNICCWKLSTNACHYTNILCVSLIYYPPSGVVYISVVSHGVCMFVCLSDNNLRKPWRMKFIFAHPVAYISREYRSSSYMKVIESRSRSQEQKGRKSLFPQCKTPIGYNYLSIKYRAVKFACSMGFSAMADRMVWPPYCDRKYQT